MKNQQFKLLALLMLALILTVTACKGTPTTSAEQVITNVALTVQADLTKTAQALPTNTATMVPTATQTLEPVTQTVEPGVSATAPTAGTPTVGTPTATTPPQTGNDRGVWVYSNPPDNSKIVAGEEFTVTVRLMNTGETTWTTAYSIKFDSGTRMGAPEKINMPYEVPPEKSVDILITFKAPETAGKVRSDWFLANAYEVNFPEIFYFEYEVIPNS